MHEAKERESRKKRRLILFECESIVMRWFQWISNEDELNGRTLRRARIWFKICFVSATLGLKIYLQRTVHELTIMLNPTVVMERMVRCTHLKAMISMEIKKQFCWNCEKDLALAQSRSTWSFAHSIYARTAFQRNNRAKRRKKREMDREKHPWLKHLFNGLQNKVWTPKLYLLKRKCSLIINSLHRALNFRFLCAFKQSKITMQQRWNGKNSPSAIIYFRYRLELYCVCICGQQFFSMFNIHLELVFLFEIAIRWFSKLKGIKQHFRAHNVKHRKIGDEFRCKVCSEL